MPWGENRVDIAQGEKPSPKNIFFFCLTPFPIWIQLLEAMSEATPNFIEDQRLRSQLCIIKVVLTLQTPVKKYPTKCLIESAIGEILMDKQTSQLFPESICLSINSW